MSISKGKRGLATYAEEILLLEMAQRRDGGMREGSAYVKFLRNGEMLPLREHRRDWRSWGASVVRGGRLRSWEFQPLGLRASW